METVTDETERQTILKLLAEEEQKQKHQQDDGDNGPKLDGVHPGRKVGQGSYRDYRQYAEE